MQSPRNHLRRLLHHDALPADLAAELHDETHYGVGGPERLYLEVILEAMIAQAVPGFRGFYITEMEPLRTARGLVVIGAFSRLVSEDGRAKLRELAYLQPELPALLRLWCKTRARVRKLENQEAQDAQRAAA